MKKLKQNKKLVMVTSIALAFIMILSATFAWFTASDSVDNKFKTGGIPTDSVKIWEIFEEPEEWKPGQDIQKDVGVANLGNEPVFVRASFNEFIQKLENEGTELKITGYDKVAEKQEGDIAVPVISMEGKADWKLVDGTDYTVTGLSADDKLYVREVKSKEKTQIFYSAATKDNGSIKATFTLGDDNKSITATDVKYQYYTQAAEIKGNWTELPFVAADKTGISKIENLIELSYHTGNMTTTLTNSQKWFYNDKDGWFYYLDTVKGGEITPFFLASVKLKEEADNTYQFLDYKLTVKTEGVQGTAEALSSWGITETTNKELYDALAAGITK